MVIDESLTLDEQFKAVKSKICSGLSTMKKLEDAMLQSQLCSVFHAIIESNLHYAKVIGTISHLVLGISAAKKN